MANTTTLDPDIIDALHAHFESGGDSKISTLKPIVGNREQIEEYIAAMKAKFPDSYSQGDETDEVPPQQEKPAGVDTPAPKEAVNPPQTQTYHLLNDKGILQPLTVVSHKGEKVILKFDEPTDLVVVQLKGKPETIDLFQLRKPGATSPFEGVTIQTLLMLGELAKG